MGGVSRRPCRGIAVALALCLIALCEWVPSPANADGGAPNLAYISGTTGGISVLDVGQGKVTKTIAIAGDPHMILLSLDGRLLYVTQPSLGQVAAIAAGTGQIVCIAHLPGHPSLLALSQDGSVLYAGGDGASSVSAINAATCQVQRTYDNGGPVYGLWGIPDGSFGSKSGQLWATGPTSVSVFDIRGPLLRTIPIAGGPQFLCIPPPGSTAYVTTRQGSVDSIDLTTGEVRQILSGGTYGSMDYDALTLDVYVPDSLHNVVDVLAPPAGSSVSPLTEPVRVFHVEAAPTSVAITSDGLFGFFALKEGRVEVFDLIDRDPVYTVSVGGTPHFVITGLYPPAQAVPQPTTITTSSPPSQSAVAGIGPLLLAIPAFLIFLGITALLIVLVRLSRSSKRG